MQLRRPTAGEIADRLGEPDPDFSYAEVGRTREIGTQIPTDLAAHYDVDRRAFSVGRGRKVFERTRDALLAWRHFDVPWVEFHGGDKLACPGQAVASVVRVARLWLVNPCRVVYVDREEESASRVRFAYGTLPGHAERGEERFTVAYDAVRDEVRYEILAFSRPANPIVRLGYPYARALQRRFAHASADALRRAVL